MHWKEPWAPWPFNEGPVSLGSPGSYLGLGFFSMGKKVFWLPNPNVKFLQQTIVSAEELPVPVLSSSCYILRLRREWVQRDLRFKPHWVLCVSLLWGKGSPPLPVGVQNHHRIDHRSRPVGLHLNAQHKFDLFRVSWNSLHFGILLSSIISRCSLFSFSQTMFCYF